MVDHFKQIVHKIKERTGLRLLEVLLIVDLLGIEVDHMTSLISTDQLCISLLRSGNHLIKMSYHNILV